MTIRNIITAAAMVAVLGLAGGSAYADDSHFDDQANTVSADANTTGTVFVYNGDSDVDFGEAQSTGGIESARLPENFQTN